MMRKIFFISVFISIFFSSCGDSNIKNIVPKIPDYSKKCNWYGDVDGCTNAVDVFYIYPTIIHDSLVGDDAVMRYFDVEDDRHIGMAYSIQRQYDKIYADSMFNFFSPLYRQVTLECFAEDEAELAKMMQVPFEDISNAFQYYMANFNDGRPFFFVGHSQGALLIIDLLKNTLSGEQAKQMVAAYVFGYGVYDEDIAASEGRLIPARDSSDVNCCIVFNCVSDTNVVLPSSFNSDVCINPITWTTSNNLANRELHKGFAQYNAATSECTYLSQFTCAYIWNNVLVCPDVDPNSVYVESIKDVIPYGSLHLLDPLLFAQDIRYNMQLRCATFFNKK